MYKIRFFIITHSKPFGFLEQLPLPVVFNRVTMQEDRLTRQDGVRLKAGGLNQDSYTLAAWARTNGKRNEMPNQGRSRMKFYKLAVMILTAVLLAPGTVLASNTVLSGIFDGTEAKADPITGTCGGDNPLAYQDTGNFQVSATGSYLVFDAFNLNGTDVAAFIYDGAFDPNNPLANLLTPNGFAGPSGIDSAATVDLTGGASYRLVVQQWCENREGAWAVTFSGPGNATSASTRMVPAMTQGLFSNNDPTATTDCSNDAPYVESGPMQVSATGTYYYTDILIEQDVDVCLQVYTAPFDPANPQDNRVGVYLDDFGTVELETGKDYYFVVQPLGVTAFGEYFYVLAPPAPFRINKALAGAWFNFETNGQGFFIDVYENSNQMFLSWFTFDLTRPDAGVPSGIGEPGHRWMTALGNYSGNVAELDIYWAEGMVFNSPTPAVSQEADGTMRVEFTACGEGEVRYDLGTSGQVGTVPVTTLAADNTELCNSMVNVPGMPGPL